MDTITKIGAIVVLVGASAVLWISVNGLKQVAVEVNRSQPAPIRVGSAAGPDIPSPYLQWGGVYEYRAAADFTATSSIVCAIQSPAATSSLRFASARVDTNPVGTIAMYISTTTQAVGYGSSTPALVAAAQILTSAQDYVMWTSAGMGTTTAYGVLGSAQTDVGGNTTGQSGENIFLLAPNTYVTFRLATGTPRTLSSYMTGKCQASFLPL